MLVVVLYYYYFGSLVINHLIYPRIEYVHLVHYVTTNTRKTRNTVSSPSPRTTTSEKEKAAKAAEQSRIQERINRCRQKVKPTTIERKTKYVERHFPGIGETNTLYVANYLHNSDTKNFHFLTSPDKWDSDDTDDETINEKEHKHLNAHGVSIPKSNEDNEYPLAHSDHYHRALTSKQTNRQNEWFGHQCLFILGRDLFKKKRITAKLAILHGMFHDQMLEWSSIATIVLKLKYSRASNIDLIFHTAIDRELEEYSNRAAKNRQKAVKTSIVAQRTQFERVSASELLKNTQMGREEIKDMSKGLEPKISNRSGESLFKWFEALDLDRRKHHSYVSALERFGKYNASNKAIEILVDCKHDELVEEAKNRFQSLNQGLHNEINNIHSEIHATYCLRALIENSVDAVVSEQVKLQLDSHNEPFYKYDGMLYLYAVLKVMNPYVMQIQLNACRDIQAIKKEPTEQWSTFLARANTLLIKARLGGTMEGERLATMSLFSVLVNIQDINGIRQKIRDMNTKFMTGETVKPWTLVAFVRDTIATDINYWRVEEIIAPISTQLPNASFLANTAPRADQNQLPNQFRRFDGPTPSWLINHTTPDKIKCAVRAPNGDWSITHQGTTFWYCYKCKRADGQFGRWNKQHPDSAHTHQLTRTQYSSTSSRHRRGQGSYRGGRSNRKPTQQHYRTQNTNEGACPPSNSQNQAQNKIDPDLLREYEQFQQFMALNKNKNKN